MKPQWTVAVKPVAGIRTTDRPQLFSPASAQSEQELTPGRRPPPRRTRSLQRQGPGVRRHGAQGRVKASTTHHRDQHSLLPHYQVLVRASAILPKDAGAGGYRLARRKSGPAACAVPANAPLEVAAQNEGVCR